MRTALVAFAVVVTLAGCEGSWWRRAEPQAEREEQERPRPGPVLPSPNLLRSGANVSLPDVVQRALPSVVNIATTRTAKLEGHGFPFDAPFFHRFFGPSPMPMPEQRGLGSGVIVQKDVIVTNNHVVEGADELTVTTSDGRELDAKVAGTDPKSDLAVLRINGKNGDLQPLPLGDSSRLRLADVVLAIGNPFGIGQTVTLGIVSATGRADLGIVDYEDFIQTDAAINPGNSGGALIDAEGNLVGIPTAIVSRTGGYMGVGFAIPSNMAKPIIDSLLKHGKVSRGWLGVSIQDVDPDIMRAMKLPSSSGVLIAGVQRGSPADKAGLERGDIVLSIDGRSVDSAGQLRNLVALGGAGRKLELEILRGRQQKKVSVTAGEMPAEEGGSVARSAPRAPSAAEGVAVQPLNPALRQRLGLPEDVRHGVAVSEIEPTSPAARAGLRPGDVVLEIDRQKVDSVERFYELFAKSEGASLLLVHRRGATLFLVVKR